MNNVIMSNPSNQPVMKLVEAPMKPFDIMVYLDASLMAIGKIVQIIKQSFEPNEITCSYVDFASDINDINDRPFVLEETAQVKNQQTMVLNGKATWPQLATFTVLMDEYLDELNQKNDLRGLERDSLSIALGVSKAWDESDRLVIVSFVEFGRLIAKLRVLKPGDDFRMQSDPELSGHANQLLRVDKIVHTPSGPWIDFFEIKHLTKIEKILIPIWRKHFPFPINGGGTRYWLIRDIDSHEGLAGRSMNSQSEEAHD